ncbi:LysM peptidoglycan-binding domain-containing protein [Colibacter massiliensis]|uniref:LysM peptidoglycan-binding domain-containing protein n=1 Tax=Colibacter massiliensis TaxID=1852379 RepID=UPI002356A9F4|nr:LysM peptidoglycan-binding domain-containing protein [Colibacter massiliensis]
MKRKIRKKNHTYGTIRFIFMAVILVASLTQLGWIGNSHKEYVTVQVHQGDTLWQIASEATADGDDVRNTVVDIVNVNNLGHNEDIYPGQILNVPVSESTAAHMHISNS